MRLVVLGLSLSSSWGNGHATTFRALLSAFAERGHEILFLERDRPWYAAHRDLAEPEAAATVAPDQSASQASDPLADAGVAPDVVVEPPPNLQQQEQEQPVIPEVLREQGD